ncbi:MAG TPA: TetR/AcrR family transcriptional regulator [Microlunatus sp.]
MSDALDEGLPRAVAIAWGMIADPQRGPKRELSHERIVEAAIELADAEGIGAVTMSKVAASLGFTTMALYRYVTAKVDLLYLMQDSVTAEVLTPADPATDEVVPAADAGGWEREVRRVIDQLYQVYLRHTWLIDIPVSAEQLLAPNNLMVADQMMRAMSDLPLTDPEKVGALLLISTFVRGAAELARDMAGEGHAAESARPTATAMRELITAERFPYLRPLVDSGAYLIDIETPPSEVDVTDYDFGIRIILNGIAQYATDTGRTVGQPQSEPGTKTQDQIAEAMGLDHVRKDPKVRDAVKQRREAESKLRESIKREREMIKNALDRG